MVNNSEHLRYEYFFVGGSWAFVFAIGLPIFAATIGFGWRRSMSSHYWRLLICTVFASLITPILVQEDNWGNPRLMDIAPAILMVLFGFMAAFDGHANDFFASFFMGLTPILFISAISFVIWTIIIRSKRNRVVTGESKDDAVPRS
jgi:hypothetical protein